MGGWQPREQGMSRRLSEMRRFGPRDVCGGLHVVQNASAAWLSQQGCGIAVHPREAEAENADRARAATWMEKHYHKFII